MVLVERHSESVRFVRMKDMFHVLDQFVILSRSAESEEAAAAGLRDDRWYGRGWSHQQRDIEDFPESRRDH